MESILSPVGQTGLSNLGMATCLGDILPTLYIYIVEKLTVTNWQYIYIYIYMLILYNQRVLDDYM